MGRRHHQVSYPKTYAEVVSLTYFGTRAGIGQITKEFTPEEWRIAEHRPGKRRYYFLRSVLRVRLIDGGEIIEIDPRGYQGKKGGYDKPGAKIKMYRKPGDHRQLFKMTGE